MPEFSAMSHVLLRNPQVAAFHKKYGAFQYSLTKNTLKLTAGQIQEIIRLPSRDLYDQMACKKRHYEFLDKPVERGALSAQKLALQTFDKPADTTDKALAAVNFTGNTIGLARHIVSVTHGEAHPLVSYGGAPLGAMWSFFSYQEMKQGFGDLQRAGEIGDAEGKRRAITTVVGGAVNFSGATLYMTAKVAECSLVAFSALGAVLEPISDSFFAVGALVGGGVAILGMVRCDRFRRRLNKFLDDKTLNERQRLRHALSFLLSLTTVTPSEAKGLSAKQIQDLAETKAKYFKRRTTVRALNKVTQGAEKLISRLNDPNDLTAVADATNLIEQVQKGNWKKILLFAVVLLAALVAIAGMVLGTIGTFGALPVILYAISIAISLSLALYNAVQQWRAHPEDGVGGNMAPVAEHAMIA